MLLLLKLNDIRVKNTQSELVQLGLDIASGVTNEKEILEWIKKHKDYINNDNKEKR
ncbi:prophage maintenance system killer protein [Desulfitispora alkaliphila]